MDRKVEMESRGQRSRHGEVETESREREGGLEGRRPRRYGQRR